LFAVTNVTQGLLAFWVVDRLVRGGRTLLAVSQVIVPYLLFFFTLVHGWDGTGYRRFFTPEGSSYSVWNGWQSVRDWLTSPVALTLLGMGIVMLPVMLGTFARWVRQGHAAHPVDGLGLAPSTATVIGLFLAMAFGLGLAPAIATSVLVHQLGWIPGLIVGGLLVWAAVLRPGALAQWVHDRLGLGMPRGGPTALPVPVEG
jgi:hypothetical protein